MVYVSIDRHKTRVYRNDLKPSVSYGVGDRIDNVRLEIHAVPHEGDLITYHPDGEPSENSWTAVVTAIQHVLKPDIPERFALGDRRQVVCITVRDERITQ